MKSEILVQTMQAEDLKAAMQLKSAEGWNQTEYDWLFFLENFPSLCLVAVEEIKVLATVTAVKYQDDLAWIGMMLVNREARGRGISKLLMREIIDRLSETKTIKLDATPAGFPVYQKMGFMEEYRLSRMVNPSVKPVSLSHNPVQIMTAGDLEKVIEQDCRSFGTNRGTLLHHLQRQAESNSLVSIQDGKIQGYVFGRPGTNYFQIGPLFAQNQEIARELLLASLKKLNGLPVVVDSMEDKPGWKEWLEGLGFQSQRTLIRMYWNANNLEDEISRQFLVAGPELG